MCMFGREEERTLGLFSVGLESQLALGKLDVLGRVNGIAWKFEPTEVGDESGLVTSKVVFL